MGTDDERIGSYDVRTGPDGTEVRGAGGPCVWLGLREAPTRLTATEAQRIAAASIEPVRVSRQQKPPRPPRRWQVVFADEQGDRVGPRFRFALEEQARRFAARLVPETPRATR